MSEPDELHEDYEPEGDPVDEPETVDEALWAVSDAVDRLAGAMRTKVASATVRRWVDVAAGARGVVATLELPCGCSARVEVDGRHPPCVRYTGAESGCVTHAVPPRVRRTETAAVPF